MTANNLKNIRKRAGYKQEEVAKLLNVTKSSVSQWESGRVSPSNDKLYALAKLYGVAMESLLNYSNGLEIREDTTEYISRPKETQEVMIPLVISIRGIGKQNNVIKYIPVPASYVSRYGREIVGIMAIGNGMLPTLTPGHYLICIPGNSWEDGNIIVADINDSETIKRIHRTANGGFDLIPDNRDYETFYLSPADINKYKIRILGRVVRSISPEL